MTEQGNAPAPIELMPAPVILDSENDHAKQLVAAFAQLKKAVKKVAFNRHDPSAFNDLFSPAFREFSAIVEATQTMHLKLEASTVTYSDVDVFTDDGQEQNLVYPLWVAGVRLLTFEAGLTLDELLRFYLVLTGVKVRPPSIDLVSALWREDFRFINWVVLDSFELAENDAQDVELEVETVLSYLKNAMSSQSGTGVSFARVSLADLDLRLENIDAIRSTNADAASLTHEESADFSSAVAKDNAYVLEKVCSILFQVIELKASDEDIDDLRAAFEQVLDGLLLQGKFKVLDQVLDTCAAFSVRPDLPVPNREFARQTEDDLLRMMQQPQRMRSITTALNSGISKDIEAVSSYLRRLGPASVVMTLNLLNSLNNPSYRRVVSNVLVDIGRHGVQLFSARLKTASSQFAKELLYIIDQIDPPNKLELFANVLEHENGVLRMEGLTAIGRNKTDQCFRMVKEVFEKHEVAQMRAHAARILAQYGDKGAPILLDAAKGVQFDVRPLGEQRAILSSLAKVESPEARSFFRDIFQEKSSILRRKLDDKKRLALSALESVPSIGSMQLLAQVAKDSRMHPKDVCENARLAALRVKAKMLGESA